MWKTWECISSLAGRTDFIYVADSKLCVSDTMQYISGRGGKFITVLPSTRREEKWFHDYIQGNEVNWIKAQVHGSEDAFEIFESPLLSSEGYRIIWVWSSWKDSTDHDTRQKAMEKSMNAIAELNRKLSGRTRMKTREAVAVKADHAIAEEEEEMFRQAKRGRPGKDTVYTRSVRKRFRVNVNSMRENIAYDERCDGIFPLITNTDLTPEEVLQNYKYQPMLEKRNEQLKSVYSIMPVLLKRIDRIEAFLFIFFAAMLIEALIERSVRLSMKSGKIRSIPVYHEGKNCESPTASRVLSLFSGVQFHRLISNGKIVEVFQPGLNTLQKNLLKLMEIDTERFYLPG
ncbi:Transposase-like protein [mine drainage metagenome]|uniref:Transposase-like protein n=1 Tax=mine drainage metagenome TaxID=410659 RepID=T0ZIL4_9ZZZZ